MRQLIVPPSLQIQIPDGPAGTRETLKQMRKLARLGKQNPANRDLANQLTAQCDEKAWFQEIRAIFAYVQKEIRYALDTNGIEVLQAPELTVELGYGDCDDKCILLGTLLECAGHPAKFVALGFNDQVREFTHVIVMTSGAGETQWMALDPTEPNPAGWAPPGVCWEMEASI